MSAHELLVRVYIDGELTVEEWLSDNDAQIDAVTARHIEILKRAEGSGALWAVEIKDPDEAESEAYVRFGSDPRGMVNPQAVTIKHRLSP